MTTPAGTPSGRQDAATARVRGIRLLAGSLIAAIPMMCLAGYSSLGTRDGGMDYPNPLIPGAQGVAFVIMWLLNELIGYRVNGPRGHARDLTANEALGAFSSSMILRFILSELVVIASIAGGFVVDSFWVILTGAFFSLVLLVMHVWPNARAVRKVEASLDRQGVRSHLTELFFGTPYASGGGAIQRL